MIDSCAYLLSKRKNESYIVDLLSVGKGQWSRVMDSVRRLGLDVSVGETIYAVALDPPEIEEGYIFILFYDVESDESLTAVYNVNALKDRAREE